MPADFARATERVPVIWLQRKLVVAIQVSLTDALVDRLKVDVGGEIARRNPVGLAIDLSGADLLDSYLTQALRDLALMAQLMGVRTVISGLSPAMAITLVEMGLELSAVATALDLDHALVMLDPGDGSSSPRLSAPGEVVL